MQKATSTPPRTSFLPSSIVFLLLWLVSTSSPASADPASTSAAAATSSGAGSVVLTVRETVGVARRAEVVRSGVPLPRNLGLKSLDRLAVLDAGGARVPAEFRVLARWNAGRDDAAAPVQWLLVAFPATVGANATAAYRLVTDGSAGANPAPERRLSISRNGDAVTVDTGAAVFRLGGDPGALFDEVKLDNGSALVTGGELSGRIQRAEAGHSTTRRVFVEHAGALSAVVVVEGQYDVPPVGGGGVGSRRRYVFTAGSPTAVVRHSVTWEGNLACNSCVKTKDGAVNGLFVERVRDQLALRLGGTPTVTAVGRFGAPAVAGSVRSGATAWVRQLLRPDRKATVAYDVQVAGAKGSGAKADGAFLAASGPAGTVGIALARMHRYEPQALRLLADGSLAVDLVDDKAWLAHHQGLFATLAVTALPGNAPRADLERLLWAPLNRPLHAWPSAAAFAGSDAVDEFPVGPLQPALAGYDTVVRSVLTSTVDEIDKRGLAGLMTFGVYPRYWAKRSADGEIDCRPGSDPTPGQGWDDLYWCGTFTDYHNTVATAPIWAMRTGEVEWLDEIGFPGALRTLHTQIMQCGPGEPWFYCGQAPAGYGAYRRDFNSSHAYFDNLFLYYWLTGDSTVVDVLQRGGENMRRRMCDTRGPANVIVPAGPGGPACPASHPLGKASMVGRVASQWLSVFRFLGLASPDGSFLEDFRLNIGRALTHEYAELTKDGVAYGFLSEDSIGDVATVQTTGSTWTNSQYDANNIYRLMRDTGDAPVGEPALAPSRALLAWARTMRDLASRIQGDGTVKGVWPRLLAYVGAGSRIGGRLVSVQGDSRPIYSPEKAGSNALFARAARMTGDKATLAAAWDHVLFTLQHAGGEGTPLGKLHGQHLSRLHAAVAQLADTEMPPSVTPPTNGPNNPKPPTPPKPPKPTPPAPPIPVNVSAPPAAPSALTAQQQAAGNVVLLSWKDNSSNEAEFRLERLVGSGWKEIRVVPAGSTGYRITGLAPGAVHKFRVRASNAKGESAYSNVAATR